MRGGRRGEGGGGGGREEEEDDDRELPVARVPMGSHKKCGTFCVLPQMG